MEPSAASAARVTGVISEPEQASGCFLASEIVATCEKIKTHCDQNRKENTPKFMKWMKAKCRFCWPMTIMIS